ncbi:contactin [Daktulosphaira vitifoliae]|uniref:contactin n=1 Tax=Daktulosphaira vitifoliae TaxID=58002 RepID=UPI0021AA115A|nr:contactin [Daktulosphaira vitifoliae]
MWYFKQKMFTLLIVACITPTLCLAQLNEIETEWRCPDFWVKYAQSCYKFVKSPIRQRPEAHRNCQAFGADLASVNNLDEHGFLINQLLHLDPQHRQWYVSGRQSSPGVWINDAENTIPLIDIENALLPEQDTTLNRDYIAYTYSNQLQKWGFQKVPGDRYLNYICEVPITKQHMVVDKRSYQYGFNIEDPLKVPRGPYFIKQPVDVVFDGTRKGITNDVTLTCIAGGYPTPTYEWFKEEYDNQDQLQSIKIDPLSNNRFTLSGGTLIIYSPKRDEDRGRYHCKATNMYGSIISESIQLSFGFIGEFNLLRPLERGNMNWGKTIFCDPPQFFPDVRYYWVRESFPNLVQEDRRVFVSYDGYLYFSALEEIDAGNYSCNVQSKVSNTGKNGPLFPLHVVMHSDYQQLILPNNFPKAFPEAPVAGQEVRLECVAFAYPVPSYNWTRKGSPLPRGSYLTSFNRVLIIPRVQVEDQGEYNCHVFNDRDSKEKSVLLSVQAEPNFTIPLEDKHMDNQADLTWTCEAFGVPDVTYKWFKNGEPLEIDKLQPDDQKRYSVQDNVLNIRYLDAERDSGMYQCQARNTYKASYSSAQLRVLSLRPSFKKKPLEPEIYGAEGKNVTIECNPEAAPKPKFTWRKDGYVIGSGGRRRILENGNLIINPVGRDDEGIYICIAQNIYGTEESQGRLIVMRGPVFVEQLSPQMRTIIQNDLLLRCQASSDELLDLAYVWSHNGMPLLNSNPEIINHITINGGELFIHNITLEDAGEYRCIVHSVVGEISSMTTLYVDGPPGPPGEVRVEVMKTSAKLQWTDGSANGRQISRYIVSGRTNWNSTWYTIATDIITKEIDRYNGRKEAYLENVLMPWSKYEIRMIAGNDIGFGKYSLPSPQVNTPPDHPYKAPLNITGGGGKIGDLTIMWKPLPPQDQNGPGIYYKVFWRRLDHDSEFQHETLQNSGNIGIAVMHVKPEFYYTRYEVKVQAFNSIGAGPISEPIVIYSAEDMPQASPQQISAISYNSTAINVTWLPIDPTRELLRGKLIGYRLKYWKKNSLDKEEDAVYYLSRTTRPWALIVGLQPDTQYYVKVMAYNSAGEGPESERFIERTYKKAPQKPPSAVSVIGENPDTIRVKWRYVAPTLEEEPIKGYKVRIWESDQDMSTANDTIIVGNILDTYISKLTPGKIYKLRVLAYSNGGDGRMSSPAHTFQMGDPKIYSPNSATRNSVIFIIILSLVLKLFSIV